MYKTRKLLHLKCLLMGIVWMLYRNYKNQKFQIVYARIRQEYRTMYIFLV